jgi:hypothetical protein
MAKVRARIMSEKFVSNPCGIATVGKAARQSISDAEASFGRCEQHNLPSDANTLRLSQRNPAATVLWQM